MGALARRLGVSDKTVTGIADRLADKQCVRRGHGEADRRVVTVELTPKGRRSFQRIQEMIYQRVDALLSCLEDTERRWLFRILGRLIERGANCSGEHP